MYIREMFNQYNVRVSDTSYIPVEENQVFNMKAYSVSRKITNLADKTMAQQCKFKSMYIG